MPGDLFLPLIETIAWDAKLTGDLGGGALPGVQQLHRLSLKLGSKPSSLSHVAPPRELIVPPFEVSVKPGSAHPVPFVSTPLESSILLARSYPLQEGGLNWSPTARVQRGSS